MLHALLHQPGGIAVRHVGWLDGWFVNLFIEISFAMFAQTYWGHAAYNQFMNTFF